MDQRNSGEAFNALSPMQQEQYRSITRELMNFAQAHSQPVFSPPTQADISRVMAELGRRSGQIGGNRRAEVLSAKKRRQIASNAAQARWAKPDGDEGKTKKL